MASKQRYYFDYAAATPLAPAVAKAMREAEKLVGNPASLHAEGRAVRAALEAARASIARVLSAQSSEIVLTSGATESNNQAILGSITAVGDQKAEIITLATEHAATRACCNVLRASGYPVHDAPIGETGLLDLAAFESLITDQTALITLALATSEIGTIQPWRDIIRVVRAVRASRVERGIDRPLIVHTDAASAVGLRPLAVDQLGIDLLTIGAAKMYGPQGVGALYVRRGTPLTPLLIGGGQEQSLRSGTPNLVGAVGLAKALEDAEARRKVEVKRLTELRDQLWKNLQAIPGILLNSSLKHSLANTLNVSFPGQDGEDLVLRLDAAGCAVATGAACAESHHQPSHVLLALGRTKREAQGSLRISLGLGSDRQAIKQLTEVLTKILAKSHK